MTSLEVRGMQPAAVLALLHSQIGGALDGDDRLTGDGWQIRSETMPRAPLGRFSVMALRLSIDGVRESEIAPIVRRMLMRGGG